MLIFLIITALLISEERLIMHYENHYFKLLLVYAVSSPVYS